MSLNQCGINPPLDLSPQRREPKTPGTPDFPCAGYAARHAPPPHPSRHCPGSTIATPAPS